MRIFCAVRHSADPTYYYGGLWSDNFYPAFRELGHEIVETGYRRARRDHTWRRGFEELFSKISLN